MDAIAHAQSISVWMKQKGNLIYEKKVIYNHRISAPLLHGEITEFLRKAAKDYKLLVAGVLMAAKTPPWQRASWVLPRVKLFAIGERSSVVHG